MDFSPITPMESSQQHMISVFGIKIDIYARINELQQKLQKTFIESKSHNALIGRFSAIKFGMLSALLTLLGIEPNTIESLKKDARKKAIEKNIENFTQNEYNAELMIIFNKGKKDRTRSRILDQLRQQLMKQMNRYDQPNFYTKSKIKDIKETQIKKILTDLLEEKQNLEYLRNFS
tara:strand:- start:236 stop:763 length:528 start_codon:yes stop_codon:yes gene_type:complete